MEFLLAICTMVQPAQQTAFSTPEAALSAYRQAIDRGDVELYAWLTAGKHGESLRKLAPVLKKTQKASEEFSRSLSEKPVLNLSNPLANDFNPLAGYQFELVELAKIKGDFQARIRFGLARRMTEETLALTKEGDTFRISLPGTFLKSLQTATPEKLNKQIESLNTLAGIMNNLAEQVKKGELKERDAILLKLAQEIKAAKLSE